jgi:hypothetical protein
MLINKVCIIRCRILVALSVVLFLGTGCLPGETPEETYAGYDEVIADGAIERGWIPEWLPQTAVDIREKHDLDRNSSILVFDAGGAFVVPEGCDLANETHRSTLTAPQWWPAAEVAELPVYDCDNGLLAVDETGMRVYFWRP